MEVFRCNIVFQTVDHATAGVGWWFHVGGDLVVYTSEVNSGYFAENYCELSVGCTCNQEIAVRLSLNDNFVEELLPRNGACFSETCRKCARSPGSYTQTGAWTVDDNVVVVREPRWRGDAYGCISFWVCW